MTATDAGDQAESTPPGPSPLTRDLTGIGQDLRRQAVLPLLAIVTALLASALIIALSDIDRLRDFDIVGIVGNIGDAYWALLRGSLGSLRAVSETLNAATPLILTGLAVAIPFQAGLFNIGGNGQLYIGGMAAIAVAINFSWLPGPLHVALAVIAAAVGGLAWGAIPGALRAQTGAHEVISTIMLNFVALRLTDWLLATSFFQATGRTDPVSSTADPDARLPQLLGFLDRSDLRVHFGFVIAVGAVVAVNWLLFRTTVGFQIRAQGANPEAARYAGMRPGLLLVAAMALGGLCAGLAGGGQLLGVQYRATPNFAGNLGFDGISVALLGRSNPYGVLLAGLLFGALRAGGQEMQVATDVPLDLIFVIQALVVIFIAAPALIRQIYRVRAAGEAARVQPGATS